MTSHPAWFIDGQTAGRRAAVLRAEGTDLLILLDDGQEVLRWPLVDIRGPRDHGGADQLVLRLDAGAARLLLDRPDVIDWARKTCPMLDSVTRDPMGTRRILIWATAAATAFLALLFVIVPTLAVWLAPLIPLETAEALGAQIRTQASAYFSRTDADERYCTAPAGAAALQLMADRLLDQNPLPYDLKLAVVDSDIVNAFAMPGGYVVILSGLIDTAESPDEVAAVLAHELGHVAARDPMRSALRSAGSAGLLSLALGDFMGGGVIATVSTQLIDAKYSRTAETAADAYAVQMLTGAGVSPDALAVFFDRLAEATTGGGPAVPPYFASHPSPDARSAAIREADAPRRARAILSDRAWSQLQNICDQRSPSP